MNDLWLRLRALLFRKRVETELDEELALHLELQARKYADAGLREEEAAARARRDFGAEGLVKEECRDQRRVSTVEILFQDVRYALRGFRRAPSFALTVIATIALGLGVNTAVFTIFNAYVLRPIAVRDPYSIYELKAWSRTQKGGYVFSLAEYKQIRAQQDVFSDVFATHSFLLRVNGRNAFCQLVTGDYFRALGVHAALGRVLAPDDASVPGRGAVAVLSYDAWQKTFGGDPEIVGKNILLHGHPFEIVGVARQGFGGIAEIPQDFFAPMSMIDQADPQPQRGVAIVGRVKPGLSVRQGNAILTAIAQRITQVQAPDQRVTGATLRSRATAVPLSPQALLTLSPILAAFAMVLLIACANVANMMLARAMARQREIGIRLSLGAARGRLIRQLLTESVLLAIPAAALGFAISQAVIEGGVRAMFATIPAEFAEYLRVVPLAPDARVFLFMMGAAIAAAVLFGLAPALQATRASVVQAARGDFTNEHRPSRLRNALVVAQITGCAALLIAAGVLLRGANRIGNLQTGMRTRDAIELRVEEKTRARALAYLASEPLVETVAASALSPLDDWFPQARVSTGNIAPFTALHTLVSPEYFRVFDIAILKGRNFAREEALSGAAVAIVSETAARRLWPNQDPIGQSIRLKPAGARSAELLHRVEAARVIGVVRDTVTSYFDNDTTRSCVYLPMDAAAAGATLIARVHGDPETARLRIDAALDRAMPGSVDEIHKMQEFVAGRQYPFRAAYWVSSAIGVLALLLTVTGVYGVMAYLVAQRTKEIGIRLALGASRPQVIGLVMKQSVVLAAAGMAIGAALGLGLSRMFSSSLDMIDTFDPAGYAAAMLVVFAACLVAAFAPSRKASRIDPIATLRYD